MPRVGQPSCDPGPGVRGRAWTEWTLARAHKPGGGCAGPGPESRTFPERECPPGGCTAGKPAVTEPSLCVEGLAPEALGGPRPKGCGCVWAAGLVCSAGKPSPCPERARLSGPPCIRACCRGPLLAWWSSPHSGTLAGWPLRESAVLSVLGYREVKVWLSPGRVRPDSTQAVGVLNDRFCVCWVRFWASAGWLLPHVPPPLPAGRSPPCPLRSPPRQAAPPVPPCAPPAGCSPCAHPRGPVLGLTSGSLSGLLWFSPLLRDWEEHADLLPGTPGWGCCGAGTQSSPSHPGRTSTARGARAAWT